LVDFHKSFRNSTSNFVKKEVFMQKELLNQIQSFHGHPCPGLAMGIRAAEIALRKSARFGGRRSRRRRRNRYVRD